ncbi:hypothetical protein Mal4_14890 [Maioricimonas rarisocia]|uniref:Uncharacterized protein n=1 Tax=Maioricimonas rarisocia TaxID=2528026 RepID=A0A517Z3W4_9PLAN|nr:hypothetical protein Mal4_14890 [Maioricimonas rarisocia]
MTSRDCAAADGYRDAGPTGLNAVEHWTSACPHAAAGATDRSCKDTPQVFRKSRRAQVGQTFLSALCTRWRFVLE